MDDIEKDLKKIIDKLTWIIDRNKSMELTKRDYRLIQIALCGYLEIREEILNAEKENTLNRQM